MAFETLTVGNEGGVLFVEINAPPMNLLGPPLVRDLVSLLEQAEADDAIKVLVFKSSDPDYFIAHVDVTRIAEYREATAKLTGEASLGLLFRYLSASRLVTIAQVEGRVRGAGSEFVLACDMCFAPESRRSLRNRKLASAWFLARAVFSTYPELWAVAGRSRSYWARRTTTLRYGWINRALPASALGGFVRSLALRIARLPAAGLVAVKDRVNAMALAPPDEFRRDSNLFLERARSRRPRTGPKTRCRAASRQEAANGIWQP
jgi:enoyl-CoA hydratase/carnithine racemase